MQLRPLPCARWPGTHGSWLACHFPWVLVWTGACYWHGVGGFMFNSSSLKAPCDTFTTIGKRHNLDTQGQRAKKENPGTVERPRWKKDLRCANHELEAAVGHNRKHFLTLFD